MDHLGPPSAVECYGEIKKLEKQIEQMKNDKAMETNYLAKFQAELKAPKNQYNSFGKYKYRSCEDILEAVKPVIRKDGFYIILTDEIVSDQGRFYVKSAAILSNGEKEYRAEGYAREPSDKKGMDESQITGAASSYARKMALAGLFAIDDTKDADGQDNGHSEEFQYLLDRLDEYEADDKEEKKIKLLKAKNLTKAMVDKELGL